ncbi:putative lipoprotein [Leptospira ryugenii]|uniref:Putative lipoprotein n=1 Tax=Leptospira ryugenii TaxID=1917863 RepID=A0A2P2E4I5_9LEPT|nr:hypothetical protein [Leptospira ryugenii]GBF51787.1 putative lipoprotein [Leptospira ryugenii]
MYQNKCSLVLLYSLIACSTAQTGIKDQKIVFQQCMDTFQDEVKCNEMVARTMKETLSAEEKANIERANLSKEQLAGLKLRQDIKDILQGKNDIYVKNYLGEPDEVKHSGERIYWEYYRPVSKFSPESEPDQKITVIFRRFSVERVEHIKPDSEKEPSIKFYKILNPNQKKDSETEKQ